MDAYQGETPHSIRQGTLQAPYSSGAAGQLMAALQGRFKTPTILARYLGPDRPLPTNPLLGTTLCYLCY
jgi:hypothetical protein